MAAHLPPVRRIVTGHTPAGKSTVLRDALQPPKALGTNYITHDLHRTNEFPARQDGELHGEWDDEITRDAAITSPHGSTFRVFDHAPGASTPFHRTESLDYAIVVSGSIVLELDDGKRVELHAGDTAVQRGTAHAWHNETTEWTRIIFVCLGAQPIVVNGQTLKEDWNVKGTQTE